MWVHRGDFEDQSNQDALNNLKCLYISGGLFSESSRA